MTLALDHERTLARALQVALDEDALRLVYQPKLHLPSGGIVGVEALARWHDLELGIIEPAVFVPLAERFGIIDALTNWGFREALRQWTAWCDDGVETEVAFNISALCLRDVHFPDYLHRLCIAGNVPPSAITLEITESATQHAVRLLDTLTRFRIKGMGLALDDFGTGYSSLLQLRQLPFTELKIDQWFVKDINASRESSLIVKSVIDLAHGLGLLAVAEGVEDAATLAALSEMGCDHAQGYFIAHPMSGAEFPTWVRARAVALDAEPASIILES